MPSVSGGPSWRLAIDPRPLIPHGRVGHMIGFPKLICEVDVIETTKKVPHRPMFTS